MVPIVATRLFRQVVLLAGVLLFSHVVAARDVSAEFRARVESAIARVRPALVRIHVVSTDYNDGREIKYQAVGSGAIITEDGYLITNHHVAGHATRMFCTLWNREEVEAELIGTDPLTDISILKLKPAKPRKFAYVEFGDSSKIKVGDSVLAMGSPMALSQSVTLGIISNTEMVMPRMFGRGARFKLDGENVGSLVRWIGHDAAIYGGNSGGPLVNLEGKIVGINEISFGLSGAIPGNLAQSVAKEIMASGKVRRSWLGLDVQPLFKHSQDKTGILVSGVVDDSPATKAGLKSGDILLELDGRPTNVRFDEQMPDFMALSTSLPIGKKVGALVRRDGKELKLTLVAEERPDFFPKQEELKKWGMTVRDLSPLLALEMGRSNTDGVLITSVRPGGPAGEAKPDIEDRDVLVEVNGSPIKDVKTLVELTRTLTEGKSELVPVIATFERKADRHLTVVKVGLRDLKDPGLEVTKAWLPVETQVISRDIAAQLGRPDLKGFYVTRVYAGSTAEKAGLKAGDFITALDGEKLTASAQEYEDELSTLIRQYDIGKTVDLTVLRDMQPQTVSVELARSPRLKREMKKYRNDDFEFTARDISFFDTAEQRWEENQQGALVEDVKSGSWAELGSLYVGDLIVEVDGQPVTGVDSLRREMDKAAADKVSVVKVKVVRGIHSAYLELEPAW